MPAPLAIPRMVISFEAPFKDVRKRADAILGRVSVVIMACVNASTPLWLAVRAVISSGNFTRIFFYRQANSNDAGGGWENFGSGHTEQFSSFATNLFAGLNTRPPGGAIGVSRIHNDRSNTAACRGQRRAPYVNGSSNDSVLREHGRRA